MPSISNPFSEVLKFIKILTFNVKEDDLACIVESRSVSLEYLSMQKLKSVYEEFLANFPTTLEQDMDMLRNQRDGMSVRKYFAVLYRSEQKRILINQIKLVKIAMHILERLMKGMTMDFAVTRVFELESKKDVIINRRMLHSYLCSLKKGLDKNRQQYLVQNDVTEQELKQQHAEKRFVEFVNRSELRQFEVKGYEKMLSRILDAPLQSSEKNQNKELSSKLLMLKSQLH